MDLNLILGALLGAGMIAFLLFIRAKDIPKPAPESPFKHLEERKAAIYENLRDLQFEYRLDKLSDEDYQATKLELQKDLAHIMAETDRIKAELGVKPQPVASPPKKPACVYCGATFDKAPKFCPECGKPVAVASAVASKEGGAA
ncbi:MAG TPA: hypothetical protein VG297_23770 [Bryobacteraceae bacterium]|nr:hypothetical protein [Bryobacteraceae bacterium]